MAPAALNRLLLMTDAPRSLVLEEMLGTQSTSTSQTCSTVGFELLKRLEAASVAAATLDNGDAGYERGLSLLKAARSLLKLETQALQLYHSRRLEGPHRHEDNVAAYIAVEKRDRARAKAEALLKTR